MSQLIANAFLSASIYALIGTGFSLIYRTSRFFHFAHGLVCAAGAYAGFFFAAELKVPLLISIVIGVAVAVILGWLMEVVVYRPLRFRGSSSLVMLLASLGVYIIGQNAISLLFGDDTKILRTAISRSFNIFGARMTSIQIIILLVSGLSLTALIIILRTTKVGVIVRAVASDPELAVVTGVDINRARVWAMALGSALAAVAGILIGLDVNLVPTMGMHALLMSVVAVIIGGIDRTFGAVVGAIFVGLLQHLGVWKLPTQWQDLIVFTALMAFLLIRPQGFLGRPLLKTIV